MDKEIYRHRDYVRAELKRIDKLPAGEIRTLALANLLRYHDNAVRNFQHERQIHLYVTITFGFICIGSWLGLLAWLIASGGCYNVVTWLLIALATILTILEGAYLGYYYRLENRTQTLYPFDQDIYTRLQSMLK